MDDDKPANKLDKLQKLAADAEIAAETTLDPNRKRTLSILALSYKRLAQFARGKR